MAAYEEAKELLREFGGLLGRAKHVPLEAEHFAYSAIAKRGKFDFEEATRTMAARPRAFGSNVVRGDAAPRARGLDVPRHSGIVIELPAIAPEDFAELRIRVAND